MSYSLKKEINNYMNKNLKNIKKLVSVGAFILVSNTATSGINSSEEIKLDDLDYEEFIINENLYSVIPSTSMISSDISIRSTLDSELSKYLVEEEVIEDDIEEEIVEEVINLTEDEVIELVMIGDLGNGSERIDNVERLGFDYKYIQSEVDSKITELTPEVVVEDSPSDSGKGIELGLFELTGYCSCSICCGIYADNRDVDENGNEIVIGASGNRLYSETSVAVDPNVIPLGTKLYIEGIGYRVAQDTGSAVKGNIIDIYSSNHDVAYSVGRQKGVKVYLSN